MKTVLEIVKNYLISNEYNGLYNENWECGCVIADLEPGDCMTSECRPGFRIECDCQCHDHDYHIGEKKNETEKNNRA